MTTFAGSRKSSPSRAVCFQTPSCCAKYQHKATVTLRAIQENSDRLMGRLLVIEAGQVRICPIL